MDTKPGCHVTVRVNNETIVFQNPADDPFLRQTVITPWLELLFNVFRFRPQVTEVIIGADQDTMDRVMAALAPPEFPIPGPEKVRKAVRRARGGDAPPPVTGHA